MIVGTIKMGYLLFIITLLATTCLAVGKGKKKKPLAAATTSDEISTILDLPCVQRTLDQWLKLPLETLRLLCTDNHLHTRGIHASLARRLFDFFNDHNNVTPVISNDSTSMSPADIAEIVRLQIRDIFSDPSILASLASQIPSQIPSNTVVSAAGQPSSSAAGLINMQIHNDTATAAQQQQQTIAAQQAIAAQLQATGRLQPPIAIIPTQTAATAHQPSSLSVDVNNNLPFELLHHQQHLSDNPPAILPSLVKKIKNREFINFDLLLPQTTAATPGEYSVQFQSDGSNSTTALSLIPKTSSNTIKVHDFSLWLVAWNNFMRTYIHFFPLMAPQLAFYQSMICQYAHRYNFDEVYTFDRNFRARTASSPLFRWDRLDPELAAQHLCTFRPICFKCKQFGHYATACPYHRPSSGTTTNRHQNQTQFNHPMMLPFRAPQRTTNQRFNTFRSSGAQQPCYYFNNYGDCNRPTCTYNHICESCHGAHPKTHCPDRSRKY